jgi:hypothetical protein
MPAVTQSRHHRPYPSLIGKARIRNVKQVRFQNALKETYDLIIAQDVLEHVENPIELATTIVHGLRVGGYAIFANCFIRDQMSLAVHIPLAPHLPLGGCSAGVEICRTGERGGACARFQKNAGKTEPSESAYAGGLSKGCRPCY